ncbi:MAG: glycosyltransferase [Nitrospirae bacterium]|nr:glycosyltransferase [Nitrospirota bacterium]
MISVIIPSYNSWPLIGKTLESLTTQNARCGEIIVSDSSDDGSDQKITTHYPHVTLLHNSGRLFPGAARNRAIDVASGSVIAMIDADAEASPDWLHAIGENFVREPEAAGFGGSIANARESSPAARIAHLLEFGGYTPAWPRRRVRMAPSCNLALRRDVFDHARFLEDWFGNEDVLLADNISRRGGHIVFDPAMSVNHHTKDDWAGIYAHMRKIGRDTGRARLRYDLPGSWLARTPGAALLVGPIKYLLALKRVIGCDRAYLGDFIRQTPRVVAAVHAFSAGFRVGIRAR